MLSLYQEEEKFLSPEMGVKAKRNLYKDNLLKWLFPIYFSYFSKIAILFNLVQPLGLHFCEGFYVHVSEWYSHAFLLLIV